MFNIAIAVLNSKFIHSSLSVWCLLSGIKAYGNPEISPTVIEGTINQNVNDVATRILNCSPDLVGLSCYIWNIKQTNELISIIKKQSPGTIIVMGGPEVSYNAEAVLMRQSSVDYIISGEGELPFALLVNSIIEHAPVDNLPGICYRDNGKIVLSEPYISNKTPPSPYTSEYFEALNNRISYLESSRGCPYNCAFCLSGRCGSVRFFDIKDTKDNILKLANSGSKTIKFVDRTFNANRKRAEEIFSFIIENYGVVIPENVCFHFEIAGDILNESTINILSTAPPGSIQLEIGLQSFNEKTLQSISRRTDTIKLRENIKQILLSGNIHTHIDLIAGLPFEDMNSLKNSFNIAYDLHPNMLQFGFLKLLHGANMRVNIDQYPCRYCSDAPYEVIETPWLSEDELVYLHGFEEALDRIYNSGRFTRTLEYIFSAVSVAPFDFFAGFSSFIGQRPAKSLDDYTDILFEYLLSLDGIERPVLRDIMVCDRLSTNSGGLLPKCLIIYNELIKKIKSDLNEDEITRQPKGVKRAVDILYTENSAIYVDYCNPHAITNQYDIRKKALR